MHSCQGKKKLAKPWLTINAQKSALQSRCLSIRYYHFISTVNAVLVLVNETAIVAVKPRVLKNFDKSCRIHYHFSDIIIIK